MCPHINHPYELFPGGGGGGVYLVWPGLLENGFLSVNCTQELRSAVDPGVTPITSVTSIGKGGRGFYTIPFPLL